MNALLQEGTVPSRRGEALKRLNTYMEDLQQRKEPIGSLEGFEREVRELVAQVEHGTGGRGRGIEPVRH